MSTSRQIDHIVSNRLTPEGVGVTVARSIGQSPRYFNPFALLDDFRLEENSLAQGIGFHPHPHRGISTLTYMLPTPDNGSVVHKDHRGHCGIVAPGGIQYMSAGKGICHSEMPLDQRALRGLQLWINLPKKDKMQDPVYQEYTPDEIPQETSPDGIVAHVIAGKAFNTEAKVKTNTPVHYIHYTMPPNTKLSHYIPAGDWSTFLYTFNGTGYVGHQAFDQDSQSLVKDGQTVFFKTSQNDQETGVDVLAGPSGFDFVLISGEPINDGARVLQYGPMIMTTPEEIQQAFSDYRSGANGFEGVVQFQRNWKPTGLD